MIAQDDIDHVMRHVDWSQFTAAKFFITGGTGFVGKWLLESLIAANDRYRLDLTITILTRNTQKFSQEASHICGRQCVEIVEGDVRDFGFPQGAYSHVIHAATDMAAGADPDYVYDVIVKGTKRVLEFAAVCKVTNFLMVSSGAVYGKYPQAISNVSEQYSGSPVTAYGRGKQDAEALASTQGAKIARLFAVTGPYLPLDANYAAGNFVRDLLAGGAIRITGDGTALRSYLYAADMAIWLLTILGRGAPGTGYNVGSEEAISIGDLARRIAGLDDGECRVEGGAVSMGAPDRYIPCTSLARSQLGLEQHITLDEGLRRMIAWNRSQVY